MRIVLELKNEPTKDDVLVYNGNEWECVSKARLLRQVTINAEAIETLKAVYENDIRELKEQINKKLKEYHDVLQLLVRE